MLELGRYQDALDTYVRSLETYRFTGELRGIMLCRMNIALGNVYLGDLDFALEQFEDLKTELALLQTPRLQTFVWFYQRKALESKGGLTEAMYHFQQALATRPESRLDAMAGDDLA